MECVRKLTKDLYWVGADDRRLELFENIHPIPRGVSYNAYVLLDEKRFFSIQLTGLSAVSSWKMSKPSLLAVPWIT